MYQSHMFLKTKNEKTYERILIVVKVKKKKKINKQFRTHA